MEHVLDRNDLRTLVETAASPYEADIDPVEVDALISGLLSGFGLRAVNLAFAARRAGAARPVERFTSRGRLKFDFEELPREELRKLLLHNSGLSAEACASVIDALENAVVNYIQHGDSLRIDKLGIVHQTENGLELMLSDDLRVPGPGAGRSLTRR